MQDDWLKRAIHFACGASLGAGLGVCAVGIWWRMTGPRADSDAVLSAILWAAPAAALAIGTLAACFLDRFWAAIQNRRWPWPGP